MTTTSAGFPLLRHVTPSGLLVLTMHPIQRAGAWALTFLADKDHPNQLARSDFEHAVGRLVRIVQDVSDVRDGKSTKETKGGGVSHQAHDLAWLWRVYNNHFPNSKATHASRRQKTQQIRHGEVRDQVRGVGVSPLDTDCAWCGRHAELTVSKATWPLGVSADYAGWGPRDVHGTPVCRTCAICAWAAPLAVTHRRERSALLDAPGDDDMARNLMRTAFDQVMAFYAARLGDAPWDETKTSQPAAVAYLLGTGVAPAAEIRLLSYRPGNRESDASWATLDHAVAMWLTQLFPDSDRRRGFDLVAAAQNKRDKEGTITVPGQARLARALFDEPGRHRAPFHRLAARAALARWPDPGAPDPIARYETTALQAATRSYITEAAT